MIRNLLASLAVGVALMTPTLAVADATAEKLDTVLDARSDDLKKRDQYRHPKEVMTLFELGEGQTVVDALPGGWYGNIIAPMIGAEGTYIGAQYSLAHQKAMRGDKYDEAKSKKFLTKFPADAAGWSEDGPAAKTMWILDADPALYGTVDRYFMIRAAHHLNKLARLDDAATEAFNLVKAGGILGIVQHRAPEGHSEEWSKGFKGYVKQSRVVDAFTKAGFVLEATSEVNANPKDQPLDGEDYVWRLLPTNKKGSLDIGESDRMTLKFRKPS